jgi:WhiB family transcriptional regulator, redox-sensing transcriptional regulator
VVPGFCTSDADPELFFPIGNAGPALLQLDQAKQVSDAESVRRAWSGP